MTRHVHRISRRIAAVLSAGVLLQAGGCEFNSAELASGLISAFISNFIGGYVYGAFNLVA